MVIFLCFFECLNDLNCSTSDGEAGGARAGDEFADQLVQAARAIDVVALAPAAGDERAGALLGLEHAADFQLAVGPHDGVGVDRQVHGDLPDGGELVAGASTPVAMPA